MEDIRLMQIRESSISINFEYINYCVFNFLLLYYCYITIILPLYYNYIIIILLLFTIILLLYYSSIFIALVLGKSRHTFELRLIYLCDYTLHVRGELCISSFILFTRTSFKTPRV